MVDVVRLVKQELILPLSKLILDDYHSPAKIRNILPIITKKGIFGSIHIDHADCDVFEFLHGVAFEKELF